MTEPAPQPALRSAAPIDARLNQEVIEALVSALDSLKYGHIGITIHDGRVMQIEVTEKTRFAGK